MYKFQGNVNKCPKDIGLETIFRIFYQKMIKQLNFLLAYALATRNLEIVVVL